jgi:hypothetical protein
MKYFSRDAALSGALAIFVALLGIWPHVRFSSEIGSFAFFKGAYDEDTYLLLWLRGVTVGYRLLSHGFLDLFYWAAGHDISRTVVLADAILPALAALSAYVLAVQIADRYSTRLLVCLLLLFGEDLFSLKNASVWTTRWAVEHFETVFGRFAGVIVPAYDTSYLGLYRTPEPQAGLFVFFLALAALLAIAKRESVTAWLACGLLLLNIVSAFSYAFLSVPLVLVQFAFSTVALAMGFGAIAAAVFAGAAVNCLTQALAFAATSLAVTNVVFFSRLPSVTPAIVASSIALLAYGGWCCLHRKATLRSWLALILLAMPIALANQQLVTGMMISTRDWERNVNYPLLVLGIGLAFSTLPIGFRTLRGVVGLRYAELAASILLCVTIVRAQSRAYGFWFPQNAVSVAMQRALTADDVPPGGTIVLSDPTLAPLLRVRTDDKFKMLLDYTVLFRKPVMPLLPSGAQAEKSPYEAHAFEFWRRTGVSPEQAEKTLRAEIEQRAGYYVAFFFSGLDSWYPASDGRKVRQQDLLALLPGIVERYREYLRSPHEQTPMVYLSERPLKDAPVGFSKQDIGTGEVAGVRVFSYWLTPASSGGPGDLH